MGVEAKKGSRLSWRWRLTGLALGATSLLVLVWAPGASAASRPLTTGVSHLPAEQNGSPLYYQRIRQAEARVVRIGIFWQGIAPGGEPVVWDPTNPADPNYRWSQPDREIRAATAAGLTPLVQIISAPRWADRCPREDPATPCDPDPGDTAAFARAAAQRYTGDFLGLPRVRHWELLNEPNLGTYFQPQMRGGKPVSPALYRNLINAFAEAVKSVRRSNLVVGPGMAPLKFRGSLGPMDFMRRLLCMKGRRRPQPASGCNQRTRFDIWTTNPYTTGGPTHKARGIDDVSLGDLPEMRRLLRAAERAGRITTSLHPVPFWVTEFSWDSKPPDPGGLPWWLHARWAAEALYRAWSAGISTFLWFGLRDEPAQGRPHHLVIDSGLYLRGDTLEADRPKRVLRAFRFPFVAFRAKRGVRVWGRTPTSSGGRVAIEVRKGRRWRKIATLRADRYGIFRKVVATGFGRKKRGLVRARYRGKSAVPFSLRYIGDFYMPAFGLPPGQAPVPQRLDPVLRSQW